MKRGVKAMALGLCSLAITLSACTSIGAQSSSNGTEQAVIPPFPIMGNPADALPVDTTFRDAPPVSAETVSQTWKTIIDGGNHGSRHLWATVSDAITGEVLFDSNSGETHIPASTLKLLTSATVLATMDTSARLSTKVLLRGNDVFLSGEGDLLLATEHGDPNATNGHAGVADLSDATLKILRERGLTSINLYWDGKLFSDQSIHPDWPNDGGIAYAGHTSAFAIDAGRTSETAYSDDPAGVVAGQLRHNLEGGGIKISKAEPRTAPEGIEKIAEVESAPMVDQLQWMLHHSDNTVAEQYCRMAAKAAGAETTYSGASKNVIATLDARRVSTAGISLTDCSGLSDKNRVSGRTLIETIHMAATSDNPQLRMLPRYLPLGGLQGTLSNRFLGGSAFANVQAKTGTLSSATTLAGMVDTSQGRTLIFAVGVQSDDNSVMDDRGSMDAFVEDLARL